MIRHSSFAATFKKLLGAAAVGAALCATSAAQAGTLDFEAPVDSPYIFAGDVVTVGNYVVEGYGLQGPDGTPGLVGSISNTEGCFGVQCPINNAGTYYSGLADGYMAFHRVDGGLFSIGTLDASFIGLGETYPALAGLLYITGFDATGIVAEIFLNLAGPTNGNFSFASYDLTGFGGGALFTDVRIASYACDANGDCNRETNQANFAIDNIVTIDAAGDVPEPGTFALMGLGLLGLGAFSRRRAA